MAKARKPKNEDQRPESLGGATLLHQKLCLSIDMEKRRIYGHTEMKFAVQEGGYVALHAENLTIKGVLVDGEPAEFDIVPHYELVEDEKRWCSVTCSKSAADIACAMYLASLDKEMVPNLIIACNKPTKSVNDKQGHLDQLNGNISQNSSVEEVVNGYDANKVQSVKLIRIDYWADGPEAGIHFGNNVLHTNNQIRRAHCWFPCVDSVLQRCCFDLEFTVSSNFVAVSNGSLLYQVLSKDDPSRKTYVYKLSVPVSAGWISLAVAPFEIIPDSHNSVITHMCLSPNFLLLQNTIAFFHSAFSHYEDYLSMSFPFGSYKQVFIPPETSVTSVNLGASVCIFSSQILFDERIIDETIDTRIKLASALARQWFGVYITPDEPNDEWLLDGLAGFLTDSFVKRFLGNNEARYQRYKANCAVCKVDVGGATALSSSASSTDLYGTQRIGLYGKIRSWKSVAVLQMLEKQMGPDSFRKILQGIVHKPVDSNRSWRTLSTKEFRHLANKIGNLERPFLKEFFPRWVEDTHGCPVLRMGLSYNKRRNLIELAVLRGCTGKLGSTLSGNVDSETRESDSGWPGMMSIRVHELDGVYDHPSLPMAGETWQLLEIQCHSKLAAKRVQKTKKGSKADGSDDNADASSTLDTRNGMDSPLLWIRVDPEMEYLAEIHFHQPVQMWVNQLEKDRDVVAQAEAIATLEKLPQLSFSVVNALNNFLCDTKAFWRVRIEAAYALAHTASEETDWAGLLQLVKFYKSRRFDADTGLPRPNDFHDVPEYFVLEAIPHAISLVRAADKKSPREAVEFVLQLLKYNDNNGNSYSDVYWLAALVQSIGELEFGQQSVLLLSSLLKHIDRLLQFDRLMPSYNGILTISCICTLTQIALKFSPSITVDGVCDLIRPFQNIKKTPWKVRIEACRALLDLEFYFKGLDSVLYLFMKFLKEEPSLRGEVKLAAHVMHLCEVNVESEPVSSIECSTLVALLQILASKKSFNNIFLRHYLFCILQIIAGRSPTLFGVPRIETCPLVSSEACIDRMKPAFLRLRISRPQEPPMDAHNVSHGSPIAETAREADTTSNCSEKSSLLRLKIRKPQDPPIDVSIHSDAPLTSGHKEADTLSTCSERRTAVVKIKVKQPASSSKADDADHMKDHSQGGNENEMGPCSSMSVDAPTRERDKEALNIMSQNVEEVNSSRDHESQMTVSISSAKLVAKNGIPKELQCTADSRKDDLPGDSSSPRVDKDDVEIINLETDALQSPLIPRKDEDKPLFVSDDTEASGKRKKDKKKVKKRKHGNNVGDKSHLDDPDYFERKRQKKAKKKWEKELVKIQSKEVMMASIELQTSSKSVDVKKPRVTVEPVSKVGETKSESMQGGMPSKFRIKIKSKSMANLES